LILSLSILPGDEKEHWGTSGAAAAAAMLSKQNTNHSNVLALEEMFKALNQVKLATLTCKTFGADAQRAQGLTEPECRIGPLQLRSKTC
jgi:hypothetical protein